MSSFTDPLQVEIAEGSWRTCRELVYWTDLLGDERVTITVPNRFKTDFASIPRIFWIILAPHDPQYVAASVVHDWLCVNHRVYGYDKADAIFYEAMTVLGTPLWKRWVLWAGVSLFHKVKSLFG